MDVSVFNRLNRPVVLVTKGRGREVFRDSSRLMRRLQEAARIDQILSIQTETSYLAEETITGLQTMLRLVGYRPFLRAASNVGRPFSRFGTRWNWAYLQLYLGAEWRSF